MKTLLKILIFLLIITGIATATYYYWPQIKQALPFSNSSSARLIHIIDGDSFLVLQDEEIKEIRLIGYDAPELAIGDQPPECLSQEAIYQVQEFFDSDRSLTLTEDNLVGDYDQYNRRLRYITLSDGRDLAYELLRQGLGRQMTVQEFHREDSYIEAELAAQVEEKGIWNPENCN